jgi:hypothetical protein
MTSLRLRPVQDRDLDQLFAFEREPTAVGAGVLLAPLDILLEIERTRPLHTRVAEHNIASAKVLTRAGFVRIGWAVSYADGVPHEVVEHIYRRERYPQEPVPVACPNRSGGTGSLTLAGVPATASTNLRQLPSASAVPT